jgi:putative transposase
MGDVIGASERRICIVLGFCRAVIRYVPKPRQRDERLKPIIPVLAWMEPRLGKRRMRTVVCNMLEPISKGAFQRLWQVLKLQVKPRRKRRFRSRSLPTAPGLRAKAANEVWCMDFMKDWTIKGFPLRILSVVDERTRRCLALSVGPRFTASDVLDVLEGLILRHGTPVNLRSDNGPEFVAKQVQRWAESAGIRLVRSAPASPWENPFAESFHSRFRDEFTEGEAFGSMEEARILCEAYRRWYNEARPHSSLKNKTPNEFAATEENRLPVPVQPGLAGAAA